MSDQYQSSNVFNPPDRLLLGPGPSNVHPKVIQAMTAPMLGHLDPDFVAIMDDVQRMLRLVFKTKEGFTLPVSGTGTAGMEAALVNLLEPGDTIVIAVNGFFGGRLEDIATRIGARVERVDFEWGSVVDPQKVREVVQRQDSVKMVGVVHVETSTGVISPLEDIAAIAHEKDALLLVDAVTSLGGCDVDMDSWDLDVVYSGTQKCLGAPSGLAPLALSGRAMEALRKRSSKVPSFYLDVSILDQYWNEGGGRTYHHTAPITMIYALWQALDLLLLEGLEERFARHHRVASALRAGLSAIGLEPIVKSNWAPPLTTVAIPDGISDTAVRGRMLREHDIEIGGGLGVFKDKAWRIGLMGYNAAPANALRVLSALEQALAAEGYEVARGRSLEAAQMSLAS
ncbi:MAG: alanine-glyoxylate transaminase / serine-glyoxylate transaminase / serine-pyruvate transaminase [Chloroflexi bacterium]|jgi:alanine-glyoxylate transaminase/serine-glyoxylate transaminase/serine-pyruvate transaminase|nr:MAG: alanine-glyoxylate transaminase / serine-glyoxylate transaminase / serine-pyruvate transaminase [Chloroflexota bacterium]